MILTLVTLAVMTSSTALSDTHIMELPDNVGEKEMNHIAKSYSTVKPSFVCSCFGTDYRQRLAYMTTYFGMLE